MDQAVADLLGAYAKTYMAEKSSGKRQTPEQKRWNTFMLALIALLIPLLPKLVAALRSLVAEVQEWLSPTMEDTLGSVSFSSPSSSSSSASEDEEPKASAPNSTSSDSIVLGGMDLGDLASTIFAAIQRVNNVETSASHSEDDTPPAKRVPRKDSAANSPPLPADDSDIFDEVEGEKPAPARFRHLMNIPSNGESVDRLLELLPSKANGFVYVCSWCRYLDGVPIAAHQKRCEQRLSKPAIKRFHRECVKKGERK